MGSKDALTQSFETRCLSNLKSDAAHQRWRLVAGITADVCIHRDDHSEIGDANRDVLYEKGHVHAHYYRGRGGRRRLDEIPTNIQCRNRAVTFMSVDAADSNGQRALRLNMHPAQPTLATFPFVVNASITEPTFSLINDVAAKTSNSDLQVQVQATDGKVSKMKIKRVVFATANERETKAILDTIREQLSGGGSPPELVGLNTPLPRWQGDLLTEEGKVSYVVSQADETGGSEAVDLLRRLVETVGPDAIFFVGCAALLDEKETHKPNVVYVARAGIDSDKHELKASERLYDMEQHHGDMMIRRTIAALATSGSFGEIKVITNRDFISGSAFVGDRSAERRRDLVGKFPKDAVVLENEAFSVYKEVFRMRSAGRQLSVSVVKGISDVGDEGAQVNKEETQRKAAANAALVVLKYLVKSAG